MRYFQYEQVKSTQDLAKKYLENKNEIQNAVFVAESQTNGYGKLNRSFYSPAKTGIYFSIAIPNFQLNQEKAGLLTPFVAIKMVHCLCHFFPQQAFQIKWVNDIYLNSRKVAGILTETHQNGLVIGIGININTTVFPKEITQKAGSIVHDSYDRAALTQSLIQSVVEAVQQYDQADFLNEYRSLSCVLNKRVQVKVGKRLVEGKTIAIDHAGRLVVESNGKALTFASGEISKVNVDCK